MERRTGEVVCQEREGERLLLEVPTSQYLGSNVSGAATFKASPRGPM